VAAAVTAAVDEPNDRHEEHEDKANDDAGRIASERAKHLKRKTQQIKYENATVSRHNIAHKKKQRAIISKMNFPLKPHMHVHVCDIHFKRKAAVNV